MIKKYVLIYMDTIFNMDIIHKHLFERGLL